MSPVLKNYSVTQAGGVANTPFNICRTFFEFKESWSLMQVGASKASDKKKLFSCKMDIEYLPMSSMPWKFSVSIDKKYRLIQGVKYLIPVDGGPVLNKNGLTVATFDRVGRSIKLQNGLIVSDVTCDADTPPILQTDGTYSAIVKGAPNNCTAPPVGPSGSSVTIVGQVNAKEYVLRTTAGRFFGTVNMDTGVIIAANGNTIGTYDTWSYNRPGVGATVNPRWTNELGFVHDGNMLSTTVIGVVQGASDTASSGTISFGNSVDYPVTSANSNYTSLQSTLFNYEKAKIQTLLDIAKAKITCIKKELTYYGVDFSTMDAATLAWKAYYDAIEVRDFPRLVTPPAVPAVPLSETAIKALETAAITAANAVQIAASSTKKEIVIGLSLLYGGGSMPLPGNTVTLPAVTTVNGAVPVGSGIIETVSLSGYTLSISARGISD
jgi:hypothetical protein